MGEFPRHADPRPSISLNLPLSKTSRPSVPPSSSFRWACSVIWNAQRLCKKGRYSFTADCKAKFHMLPDWEAPTSWSDSQHQLAVAPVCCGGFSLNSSRNSSSASLGRHPLPAQSVPMTWTSYSRILTSLLSIPPFHPTPLPSCLGVLSFSAEVYLSESLSYRWSGLKSPAPICNFTLLTYWQNFSRVFLSSTSHSCATETGQS